MEIETQVVIAANLGYLVQGEANGLLNKSAEVGRILNGLLASMRK